MDWLIGRRAGRRSSGGFPRSSYTSFGHASVEVKVDEVGERRNEDDAEDDPVLDQLLL